MASSTDHASIYREAARLLAEGKEHWGCHAIRSASADELSCDAFGEVFRPKDIDPEREELQGWWGGNLRIEARDERILALCFMAAMVEAGDA